MSRVPSLSSPFLLGFDAIERAPGTRAHGSDDRHPGAGVTDNQDSTRKESSAMTNEATRINAISLEALAILGGGKIAYVKTVRSEDVQKLFPQAPEIAAGTLL